MSVYQKIPNIQTGRESVVQCETDDRPGLTSFKYVLLDTCDKGTMSGVEMLRYASKVHWLIYLQLMHNTVRGATTNL